MNKVPSKIESIFKQLKLNYSEASEANLKALSKSHPNEDGIIPPEVAFEITSTTFYKNGIEYALDLLVDAYPDLLVED